jgi:hypothetical protein
MRNRRRPRAFSAHGDWIRAKTGQAQREPVAVRQEPVYGRWPCVLLGAVDQHALCVTWPQFLQNLFCYSLCPLALYVSVTFQRARVCVGNLSIVTHDFFLLSIVDTSLCTAHSRNHFFCPARRCGLTDMSPEDIYRMDDLESANCCDTYAATEWPHLKLGREHHSECSQ